MADFIVVEMLSGHTHIMGPYKENELVIFLQSDNKIEKSRKKITADNVTIAEEKYPCLKCRSSKK